MTDKVAGPDGSALSEGLGVRSRSEFLSVELWLVEAQEAHMQSATNTMLAARLWMALAEYLAAPIAPSERQLRWAASYWRERRKADAAFAAAFPNWKHA